MRLRIQNIKCAKNTESRVASRLNESVPRHSPRHKTKTIISVHGVRKRLVKMKSAVLCAVLANVKHTKSGL
jgi:hypothetical protein